MTETPEKKPDPNAEAIRLLDNQNLRDKPLMEELLSSKAFKRYQEMLVLQINTRLVAMKTPLAMRNAVPGAPFEDFHTRVVRDEAIKGAIMGLELAHNLPTITIDQAKNAAKARGGKEDE